MNSGLNIMLSLFKIINGGVGEPLVAAPSDRKVTLEEMVEKAIQLVVQSQHVVVPTPGQHWSLRLESLRLSLTSELI